MRILFLTFYFEPDLCAGSFRNTSLFKELCSQINAGDFIHVITTQPNRYKTFKSNGEKVEKGENYEINRIKIPEHSSKMFDQAKSFFAFYRKTLKLVKKRDYDLVYASSSRLFTAFLGQTIATSKRIPLYLDIRDIFVDTIKDVLGSRKILQKPVAVFAKHIEKYTFTNAQHINLVSEGFKSYFLKYPKPTYTYYTNGIDDEFVNLNNNAKSINSKPIVITYAGNIGSGQGLEKIIPLAAKKLGNKYLFRIIGDGGMKKMLIQKIEEEGVKNVEIIDPVSRTLLIEYYNESTFLFLHLNDYEAFKKVLPSKIFEYGAFDKPIIAGVSGYSADFIRENLSNYILFNPTDVDDLVKYIESFKIVYFKRDFFIQKYSRKMIMKDMAHSILSIQI
jgi:glycosyltransferase involved in cell wall biosynthesis